jgi:predicted N-acetyltransferase YhbS
MQINLETPTDYKTVERLTFEAFKTFSSPYLPPRECPDEHYLVHLMRNCPAFIPELDFVGRIGDEIVAHIMYSKSKIVRPNGDEVETVTFGPVSVKPELQNCGYGTEIIRYSLEVAKEQGFGAIIIVGHENYYPRVGFHPASNYGLTMPDGSTFAPFMALELKPGYLGVAGGKWYEDEVYHIDEAAFHKWHEEEWDK